MHAKDNSGLMQDFKSISMPLAIEQTVQPWMPLKVSWDLNAMAATKEED
jgi:hypothetical protein